MSVHEHVKASIESWPLMSSPVSLSLILVVYLCFVLKIGPIYMKDKKPKNLTNFTRIYNVLQVVACTGFVYFGYLNGFSMKTAWKCSESEIIYEKWMMYKKSQWTFLLLRLAELSETVVFVLRKKQNQVSFLHVYHHISTAAIVWIYIKFNSCEFMTNFKKKCLKLF